MAKLPLDQAVVRFQGNDERMDKFANGSTSESFTTSSGVSVPSISRFLSLIGLASPGPIGSATPSTGAFTTLSSSSDATIHGVKIGLGAGGISTNTAVGLSAIATNSSGAQLVAVGVNALTGNTIGAYNSAFGVNALAGNTTGSANNAFGVQALQLNTAGGGNSAFGDHALYQCSSSNNTAVGYQSGMAITTGAKNTIIGSYNGAAAPISATGNNFVVLSDGDGNIVASTKTAQTFALGGATPAAGTGITFPATQSVSSDANTLDDYEEGTWTPTQGAGLTVVGAFSSAGTYTKVGRQVTVTGYIAGATSVASTANTVAFNGLPFSQIVYGTVYAIGSAINQATTQTGAVLVTSSSGYISTMSATPQLDFTITYFV